MPGIAAIAIVLFFAGTAHGSAESANVTARIGQGVTATATATPVEGEGVLLEIALPEGRNQTFPRLGEQLVPLSGEPGEAGLLVRDLDGDGIDEIILRGSVPQRSAVVVLRWSPSAQEFIPIEFTDDLYRTMPFLVADAALPVLIDPSGMIEVHHMSVRQDGRKSYHVARYRWDGAGYTQSADN